MIRIMIVVILLASLPVAVHAADSLPKLTETPQTVEASWANYDPTAEPMQSATVREWVADGVTFRYVTYRVGVFKGKPATMAGFYAFPVGKKNLPALLHMHGGGQRANLGLVYRYAKRGYAALSINWGGKPMEKAELGEPNTDWGAVDPTQNNVGGYSNLLPKPNTIDPFPSARNNNWFLVTLSGRRGITFLQKQPQVDPERIGVLGHSMGGRLTGLVSGSDARVKVASPSVGGTGFLQVNLWGLPGSARRVHGDLKLFQQTISGQAYLARVNCPYLFLTSTNDFNAPMEYVALGMKQVKAKQTQQVYAPHLNHRFTPEAEVARRLWFDAYLHGRFKFPKAPQLSIKVEQGVPVASVDVDTTRPVEKVNLYYGYERDPRNRYWDDARAEKVGDAWRGACPVFDASEPLFVLANVHYKLAEDERLADRDPTTFILSVTQAIYPDQLSKMGVKATAKKQDVIEDFKRGYHDWYQLGWGNPHHWHAATRKLVDPRWEAPKGAKLAFKVTTDKPNCTLGIQLNLDSWRGYTGRRPRIYVAMVKLEKAGTRAVALSTGDFKDIHGKPLEDWFGITELGFRPGNRAVEDLYRRHRGPKPDQPKSIERWNGKAPTFADMRWVGGEPVRRPKPFLSTGAADSSGGGLLSDEFQKAIQDSIELEKRDGR